MWRWEGSFGGGGVLGCGGALWWLVLMVGCGRCCGCREEERVTGAVKAETYKR
jgi:hypothetical protein